MYVVLEPFTRLFLNTLRPHFLILFLFIYLFFKQQAVTICHDKSNAVCLQSFRRVCSSLGLLSFFMYFCLYISAGRAVIYSKMHLHHKKLPVRFPAETKKMNSISAIIFQLWNVRLKSCDYNFSCTELFVLPYCYHMWCFFCS